ncbi:hypothetical protein SNE40_018820 [Patella caerulea]|uniref:CUB domain-containing protein n=1 Tax=Patella caerulea TaxID=87958 RepID=A0AAN8J5P6_PATCE
MDKISMGIIVLMCLFASGVSSYAPVKYMNTNCGQSVYVISANRIQLDAYMVESMPRNCRVTIETSDISLDIHNTSSRIQFLHFNVPCDEGKVVLYGFMEGDGSYCNDNAPTKFLKSNSDLSMIAFDKYHTNSDYSASFELLVTETHNGDCGHLDFSCKNGGCINDVLLTCDGNNNCGDDSDEQAVACIWFLPVVITVPIVTVCGFIIVILLLKKKLRLRPRGKFTSRVS